MNSWIDNEDGPWCKHCHCKGLAPGEVCDPDHGWPTVVKIMPDGGVVLMCFGHTQEAGLLLPLTFDRPEDWPSWNMRDVAVRLGYAKEDA